MRKMAIGLLLGSMSALLLADLPHFVLSGSILFVSVFFPIYFNLNGKSIFSLLLAVMIGFSLTTFVADLQKRASFTAAHEGKDLVVTGKVASMVSFHDNSLSFLYKVSSAKTVEGDVSLNWNGLIRLSAYRDLPDVKAGEHWQFQVRLKRSSGFMNPAGFDYEKWLFAEGIDARGYLRKSTLHKRLEDAPWYSINQWRASIHDNIHRLVKEENNAAIISALMIADKSAVSQRQWEVLRETGTSHLMAISGLHIGLVAAFGVVVVYSIWWLFPILSLHVPVRTAGAVLGVVFALIYALLAGLSIPTQRALLMVVVALVFLMSRQYFSPSRVLAMAMVVVLIANPLAVMSVGFFLSFSAVTIILWILSRHTGEQRFNLLRLQGYLSLLMIPIGFVFFGEGSLVSPLANLIAIPWVSLVVVPFSFLAVLLSYVSDSLSLFVFDFITLHLEGLFSLLERLAEFPKASISKQALPLLLSTLLVVVAALMLLPSGTKWRYTAVLALIPLVLYQSPKPGQGDFWLTVLDVGQGLAVVVQTRDKTLVYDTGDRPNENFDLGKMVVLPYLQQQSTQQIDALVVSHDDRDHRGGASALFDALLVDKLYSNRSDALEGYEAIVCQQAMTWSWNDVVFEFLHPGPSMTGKDNDRSCVLKVSNPQHSVLLTGDILKRAERLLLKLQRDKLDSDILLMPHHGSNSSSTGAFISAVSPQWAIASAGYRSRFKHPHTRVLKRYEAQGVGILNTADDGAVQFHLSRNDEVRKPTRYRLDNGRFWSRIPTTN
ncbi:DNA internalization-related competence protein ComEC/Rec2 [Leucothrix pacifica]|uniref:DNA internalization-related competence protein ComEC/Rec2 n=1 Tax=Leucothrix pacifica TaxID=1247513 RepID=A0A317CPH6_9GAMM|nr:DNA internalization-related competence protein ComEC/Rec2 [Leucothrix pacifica]PWR00335.1 DNA internalization-related competence protein ComEC/Rec2 [Leucothrix pacifica]